MRLRCELPHPSWVSKPPSTWKEAVGARRSTGHGLPSLAIDALSLYGQTQSNVTEASADQILDEAYMCRLFTRRSWVHTSLTRFVIVKVSFGVVAQILQDRRDLPHTRISSRAATKRR